MKRGRRLVAAAASQMAKWKAEGYPEEYAGVQKPKRKRQRREEEDADPPFDHYEDGYRDFVAQGCPKDFKPSAKQLQSASSPAYFDRLLREGCPAGEACIGDEDTDALTKLWLTQVMNEGLFKECWQGTVMELMAGQGRNYGVYKHLFETFHMLDGSKEMVALMPKEVEQKWHSNLEAFKWNRNLYDCILGVFCLGYILAEQLPKVLAGIQKGLTATGIVIMAEPVLERGKSKEERHEITEQRLWVRPAQFYVQQLQAAGFEVFKQPRFDKEAALSHDLVFFVARRKGS